MKRSPVVVAVVVVVVALALLIGGDVSARTRVGVWSIVPLGMLPDATFSEAVAINNRNEIAGSSGSSGETVHAVLWRDGEIIDLGTLGGAASRAWGINDRGQVVGAALTASGEDHAFLWEDGVMTDLSAAGPFQRAFAVNQRGEIVGHQQFQSLLWRDGELIPLALGSARDINDRTDVAGSIFIVEPEFVSHAALWRDGEIRDLGVVPGGTSSAAWAVNRHRVVVGEGLVGGIVQGFRWEDGVMVRLPSLIAQGATFALDVNDHGVIVGESMSNPNAIGGEPHAVAWVGERLIDLGTLPGGTVSVARTINNRGVIAGFSNDAEGRAQAAAWIPR
jgi:probable HAF family extracellular repeat protein